ncbi:MAG: IS1380 family transposase, partial [Planctomycetes bacterium]|nr:IS1380 family transposase [Planctomycetota bacterium]
MKNRSAMRAARRKMLSRRRGRSVVRRLLRRDDAERLVPVLSAKGIEYEVARRGCAIGAGGIGLAAAIDRRLQLLKIHRPYHESDHVLSLAYNILAGGTCIEDLERLREDE